MVRRKKEEKRCVVCGKRITGSKDYCPECHEKILQKMKNSRKERKNHYKVAFD